MTTDQDRFKLIGVEELADRLVERPTSTWLYDANPAARRAVDAGYTDVNVMADGLTGWVASGRPTAKTEAGSG